MALLPLPVIGSTCPTSQDSWEQYCAEQLFSELRYPGCVNVGHSRKLCSQGNNSQVVLKRTTSGSVQYRVCLCSGIEGIVCKMDLCNAVLPLLLTRCTRDQRPPSVSQTCRQTVNIGSESAPAASPKTLPAVKNCMDLTAPVRCSHLRNRSWFHRVLTWWRSWQRLRRHYVKSASSPSFFSADSQWLLFYSLLLFSTL